MRDPEGDEFCLQWGNASGASRAESKKKECRDLLFFFA